MRLKTQVRIVAVVALAGLLTGLALLLRAEAGPLWAINRGAAELETIGRLDALVHELQRERALSQALRVDVLQHAGLTQQHANTDAALARAGSGVPGAGVATALDDHRSEVLADRTTASACHAHYSALISRLLRRTALLARGAHLDALRAPLGAHAALARAKEQLGQLRALVLRLPGETGRAALADDAATGVGLTDLPLRALQQLAVFDAAAAAALDEVDGEDAAALRALLEASTLRGVRGRAEALARRGGPATAHDADAWYAQATAAIDALHALQQRSLVRMQALARDELAAAGAGLAWRSGAVTLAWLASCWLVYAALRRLLGTIRRLDADTRAMLGRLGAAAGGDGDGDGAETPIDGRAGGAVGRRGDIADGFMRLVERVDRLSEQASTDALTGVLNRHGLQPLFAAERERARRYGRTLVLVLADIDHFKQVNDRHGHAVGDVVLRAFARFLREQVRAGDIVARWGGEEFVVVAPECDDAAGAALADKLRAAVAAHLFALPRPLTASFGVAQLQDHDDLDMLVSRADAALYHAKALGRNRVCRASAAMPVAAGRA